MPVSNNKLCANNNMDVRKIRIEDFDYPLPDERIALHPLEKRDACKLLVANASGKISHHVFSDLPILIHPDTLIVANETKVIRARMEFEKSSGARIEIFLLEPSAPHDYVVNFASTGSCSWVCLVGNKKRWKDNPLSKELLIGDSKVMLNAFKGESAADSSSLEVRFEWDNPAFSFAEIVEAAGNIPIPPYLRRQSEESDTINYQTVYSRTEGSVAAPTAGLHFTPELISELKKYGNEFATVTLHVGAGTFQPVKSEQIGDHPMHTEWISVSRHTLLRIINALENGRDILAVGTTSVRTLESLPYLGIQIGKSGAPIVTQWMPYEDRFKNIDPVEALKNLLRYLDDNQLDSLEATTSIMIAPGFRWRIVNRLITNFHQPKSTLLLLVSSFLGGDVWRQIYDVALAEGYRFLSYGDACLFSRGPQSVELPLSKSMVLRAATIDAIRSPEKLEELCNFSLCDDSEFYIRGLQKVLASVSENDVAEVYIGEGAAPLRFLTAFAASLPGSKVKITCAEGLRKRPVKPLIETLLAMGANIRYSDDPLDWYISVRGKKLQGAEVKVDSSFTSQYLSALLLASPLWENYDGISLSQPTVSRPYLEMTVKMMENPSLQPEHDWSGAAFFYEYALISRKDVIISSLTPPSQSLQGDSVVCDLYDMLGVNTEFNLHSGEARLSFDSVAFELGRQREAFEFDFSGCPDLVPSVAVALCYCRLPFRFHGVGHLRYKECDRLSVLQSILVRIGYEIEVENEELIFNGVFKPLQDFPLEIDPYGDHRMAMAFYPLELIGMANVIDKQVVSKSFPDFYRQFKNLT